MFCAAYNIDIPQAEARARMITDNIILRVMSFLREKLSLVPLLFLELILSTSNDSRPVFIRHRNWATLITGSVDYAISSSVATADRLSMTKLKDRGCQQSYNR